MKPLIIAVEGIDGSGKTTFIEELSKKFTSLSFNVSKRKLVYRTINLLKENIDKLTMIEGSYQSIVPDPIRSDIYSIEAYLNYLDILENRNLDIIIFDRWFPIVDVKTGFDVSWELDSSPYDIFRKYLPEPDLIIWLDIDINVAAQRLIEREDWMAKNNDLDQLHFLLNKLQVRHSFKWSNRENVIKIITDIPSKEIVENEINIILSYLKVKES